MSKNHDYSTDWVVVYQTAGSDQNQLFRCTAYGIIDAVAQCTAGVSDRIVVHASRVDANALVPDPDGDFVLTDDVRGTWVIARNLSIHLYERGDAFSIAAYGHGREFDDELSSLSLSLNESAEAALLPANGAVGEAKAFCEGMGADALRAHLEVLTDKTLQADLTRELADQLAG